MFRKPYSWGSGESGCRYSRTCLPAARRTSAAADIEPMASPSGFSWEAIRTRSAAASAATTASRSRVGWLSVIGGLVDRLLGPGCGLERFEQLVHPQGLVDGLIILKDQLRGMPDMQ